MPIRLPLVGDRELSVSRFATAMIVIGVLFAIVYFLSYPRFPSTDIVFTDPKARVDYVLSQRWFQGFSYSLPYQFTVPAPLRLALTPRDAAFLHGVVVPKEFGGALLLFGLLQAISHLLVLVALPIMGVLTGVVVALIARELFGKTSALIAYVLWLSTPALWINSSWVISADVPALLFLLAGVYSLLRYMKEQRDGFLVSASVFLSVAIALRYPHALVAVPVGLAVLLVRRPSFYSLLKAVQAALPAAVVLLLLNRVVYGDPLQTGYSLHEDMLTATLNFQSTSFFSFDLAALLSLFGTYFTNPILFLPLYGGVASIIYLFRREEWVRCGALVFAAASASVIIIGFYGGRQTWGAQEFFLNASFLRYFLPALALWMPLFAGTLAAVTERAKYPMVVLLLGVIAVNSYITLGSQGGVMQMHEDAGVVREIRARVLDHTEPRGIIVTRLMDKALFPDRTTLTATYLVHNETPVPQETLLYRYVPSADQLASALAAVAEAGIPAYLLNDGVIRNTAELESPLAERGYLLQSLGSAAGIDLYRVISQDSPTTL